MMIHMETLVAIPAQTTMSREMNLAAETMTLRTSSLREIAAYAEVEALDTMNIITQNTTTTLKNTTTQKSTITLMITITLMNIITQMVDLTGISTPKKNALITTILLIVEMILVVNTMTYSLLHVDFMILKTSSLQENAAHAVEEALGTIPRGMKCQHGLNPKTSREAEQEREDGTNQWGLSQRRSETQLLKLNKQEPKCQTV